ncbi:hypothetical protein BJ508DRAFT_325381 [Ascobolus immersus RN42]|uniref:F-box domain-containing protein n=1 Tax=Ascobolus immersus RN42 TaxID=1160509 RepID=A0A3N4I981_ASCIM|nr:hypothetical protein BJ508DRAFT_325381 [Ascobolus immersus RN42]
MSLISSKSGDVRLLRISERSNALQFSRSLFFNGASSPFDPTSSTWARNTTTKAYSYLRTLDQARSNPNLLASQRQRKLLTESGSSDLNIEAQRKAQQSSSTTSGGRIQYRFSSLLPPIQNTILKANSKRLSSSGSIRSFASSLGRKRKYTPPANLHTLPTEIIDEIARYLDQKTLHALLLTAKRTTDPAAVALYRAPQFASTYRFAQFVHIVSRKRYYASKVKHLDLATMVASMDPEEAVAGWREWKFRFDPLHTIRKEKGSPEPEKEKSKAVTVYANDKKPKYKRMRRWSKVNKEQPKILYTVQTTDKNGGKVGKKGTHPQPSKFLEQFHTSRDVPLGAVLHLLAACPSLRSLDLSNVQLSEDYAMPPSPKSQPAETFTGLVFVSDTPRRHLWNDSQVNKVTAQTHINNAILKLHRLEELKVAGATWVNKEIVTRWLKECRGLKHVDFTGCGMVARLAWAIEGTVQQVMDILEPPPVVEEDDW